MTHERKYILPVPAHARTTVNCAGVAPQRMVGEFSGKFWRVVQGAEQGVGGCTARDDPMLPHTVHTAV